MTGSSRPTLTETKAALGDLIIPVQPNLITRIRAAYPDLESISYEVRRDPALCFAVLKLVNNPRFELPAQCSIGDAIDFLGIDNINMMINAVLLAMAKQKAFNSYALQDYWDTSRAVANCAAQAARQLNIALVDEAYCVGMLHHIGMPILWQKFPSYFELIRGDADLSLAEKEAALFNSDHATVGYYLAKGVRLSTPICETIRDHHETALLFANFGSQDETKLMLMALLKLAEVVVEEDVVLLDLETDVQWELIKKSVLELLGLSEFDYGDLRETLLEH